MKYLSIITSIALVSQFVLAQEGSTAHVSTTAGPATYSCDPNTCKIENNCRCASMDPPGGLSPADIPQFVTVTYDDSIQSNLMKTALSMVDVTNPNGCPGHGTWFVSMEYTDFSLVQQWYAAGNEVADHTFSHVGSPSAVEISSAREMLNAYGGIPVSKIQGFRAPFLNYTKETLGHVGEQQFVYDSSASADTADIYWPYTLDNGMANDCWTGICDPGQVKIPGLWEIPMYSVHNNANVPQLMDVYLAGTAEETTQWSKAEFDKHYNGKRQPFGIYVHPTQLTLTDETKVKLEALLKFIKEISTKPNVWFVTNQQLLQWVKNPVKASELGAQDYMQCKQPVIAKEICNGLDDDHNGVVDDGLVNSCNFGTTSMKTCFNCPATAPQLSTPVPASAVQSGAPNYRFPLGDGCDTTWWDPVGNTCLCTTSDCQVKSMAVPKSNSSDVTVAGGSTSKDNNKDSNANGVSSSHTTSILSTAFVAALLAGLNQLL
ncbi:hypothetical protein BD770DRAFT_119398 [Pilaira anomala]|nr:hypothetical protein BD770DRAFT_119398 [Pilaira anomala]